MARTVTVIPQTIDFFTKAPTNALVKRNVGAYTRVSTDSEEQQSSYEAQIDYFTNYIKNNPAWNFVKIYTDEGITGTNTKKRDGFNEMIEDALNGKLDLIVCKSLSRFARNTVDSLSTIRKLKSHGVEVFFEKENVYTFDSKGELMITILSSIAQEESRNISENVTWGQRKRFADGKVSLPYGRFLGYEKGENDIPQIVPEEAAIIRRIYSLFMSGKTDRGIASILTAEEIPTPSGKGIWRSSTIKSILTNEKYKGSAILQKTFTIDFLTKKMKINEGEVPQYYVEHSHEPIIEPEEWEAVQAEIARRKTMGNKYSGTSVFASRIVCGDCGAYYGSKVWHSNSKYRRVIYRCNRKFDGENKCQTPTLTEDDIKARFITAFNKLFDNRTALIEDCRIAQTLLTDCTDIQPAIDELNQEMLVIAELTQKCIIENSVIAQDQEEYQRKYNSFVVRYEKAKEKLTQLEKQKAEKLRKADEIGGFMFCIMELNNGIEVFDNNLFLSVIDVIIANPNGDLVFKFKNGLEIVG